MGGAPIGHDPHFYRQRGTGHNLGIIYISHIDLDNHKVNVEYTKIITEVASLSVSYKKQTYELGWLSYLSNILSPSLAKSGGQKFSARSAHRNCPPPTFKTVGRPSNCCNSKWQRNRGAGAKIALKFCNHDGGEITCAVKLEHYRTKKEQPDEQSENGKYVLSALFYPFEI